MPNIQISQSFVDKGFVSTSVDQQNLKEVLHSDINTCQSIAKIKIPNGTSCVTIGKDFSRNESELLLTRELEYKLISRVEKLYEFEII